MEFNNENEPVKFEQPNDISAFGPPVDNHDDGPEPESKSLYLDKDKMFSNHDDGPDDPPFPPPPGIAIEREPDVVEYTPEEGEVVTLPPRTFEEIHKEQAYYEKMKEELSGGMTNEVERETVSLGR